PAGLAGDGRAAAAAATASPRRTWARSARGRPSRGWGPAGRGVPMNEEASLKRVGLIGCGAIGRPVARALLARNAGPHSLAAVLARTARDLDGVPGTGSAGKVLGGGDGLLIEAGGAAAFRALVPAALERCEVWAVSPIPLADPGLEREIRGISASTGHALRIAPGALAAFDGIATAMAGGLERLDAFIDLGA